MGGLDHEWEAIELGILREDFLVELGILGTCGRSYVHDVMLCDIMYRTSVHDSEL